MEHSAEVEAVVRDFFHAMGKGDVAGMDAMTSTTEIRMVGTDPEEWWGPARADVMRVFTAQLEEMGGTMTVDPYELEGYAEGTVGWAAAKVRFQTAALGAEARMTAVLHQESDGWRLVQGHVSFGVPNAEAFGQDLTTA